MKKEISTTSKIRFNDCDPIGHLNNIKYLEYMFNAREDHVEEFYGFTYEEYTQKTGCTWVTVQNEIAFLKEVRYNTNVHISSKTVQMDNRTSVVEILMKSEDERTIHAVLWITVVYFDMKTRRVAILPAETKALFEKYLVNLEQENFRERVAFLRKQNRQKNSKS